jgi:predicted ATPase/DNA-binding CsgD family transcriptional regulator
MARPRRQTGNLPAEPTSFVGRRRELAEIRKKLADARLVSLVGPGGVGKTRLAITAAADLARRFPAGGWLAELAEVPDPALVCNAVITALDLRDQAAAEPLSLLLAYLRDAELLLVLDNCEHVLESTTQLVTDVLRAAPGVRVIATSREPLSAPGEHVIPVPPLELPAPRATLAGVRHNEAVRLFVERAAASAGTFELTEANHTAVQELCRRLDGLPLAIELAAVRMRVLTAEQILDRLSDRFGLLTSRSRAALPRHQTLRTAIEWSHDLLADDERAVLRRSSVFAGRFTLDDARSVCAVDGDADASMLDLVSSLVEKSLVTKEEATEVACYRLHETMREFARLKLAEAAESDRVELRCADFYRMSCLQRALDNRFRLPEWLAWIDLEIDNVRAVLQRCVNQADAERGIDLSVSLGWYWATRSTTEGMRWLGEFLAMDGGQPEMRAWALFIRGFLATLKADHVAASPLLLAAAAAARQTNQRDVLANALSLASVAANMSGDRVFAERLMGEARLAAAGGDYVATISILKAQALNGFFDRDLDAVRSAGADGTRLARQVNDRYALGMMLLNLGSAYLIAGDLDQARPLLAEALQSAHEIDDRVGQYYLLHALGCHAALTGKARLAAQLLGAALTVRTEAGANVMSFIAPQLGQAEESARAAIGSARYDAEFAAGRQLNRHAAADLALGQSAQSGLSSADGSDARTGVLAPREADVARLVADGLTNKQVGARLFISERTVETHVRSVMNKLGVSSRAQIAAWVASDQRAVSPGSL